MVEERFWPTTAAAWADVLGFGLLLAASVIAWLSIRHAGRTRHAHLLAEISRRWSEPELEESRRLAASYGKMLPTWVSIHLRTNDEEIFALVREPDFFEDIAVMVQTRVVSFRMVRESLGLLIWEEWRLWEPGVQVLRAAAGDDPLVYGNWERLAKRMRAEVWSGPGTRYRHPWFPASGQHPWFSRA